MNKNYLKHERKLTVAVGDMDFRRRMKPSAIMGYLQDIATEHADILGIGYDDLIKKELGWVMVRMSIEILKMPIIGDILTLKTFPEKPSKSDVNRGYYIYGDKGGLLITASSKWCVLDMKNYRVQRLSPLFERFGDDEYIPGEPLLNANPKVERLSESTIKEPKVFTVQVTDLDHNGHMNNARYGDVILNALGMETLREFNISRIDMNFTEQLFFGDKYEVLNEHIEGAFLIEARKAETEKVVFRAKVE